MKHAFIRNKEQVGKTHKVLVEGVSKKIERRIIRKKFTKYCCCIPRRRIQGWRLCLVNVKDCTSATLKGKAIKLL